MKTQSAPASPAQYLLIRQAHAPKLGQRANGQLGYQVLLDPDRDDLYLRISENRGGGYFSDEAVSLAAIRACLDGHAEGEPLRAAAFRGAYVGRSNNNAGFLAAALVAEGLLLRDEEQPHLLADAGAWEAWEAAQRAGRGGELPVVRIGKVEAEPEAEAPVVEEPPPATKDKKARAAKPKSGKKASAEPSAPDDAGEADPA